MMTTPIESLPPACKLGLKVLEYEAPLSQSELIEQTRLNERTAKRALARLENSGLVVAERSPSDAREKRYRLDESAR